MDQSSRRVLAALAVVAALIALGVRELGQSASLAGPPDVPPIPGEARAAALRFAPGVAQRDRAWVLAAIARARPEAQGLIGEVDGMVEVRTHRGNPLGVTDSTVSRRGASFTIDLDIATL